jgi:hypothetical protein
MYTCNISELGASNFWKISHNYTCNSHIHADTSTTYIYNQYISIHVYKHIHTYRQIHSNAYRYRLTYVYKQIYSIQTIHTNTYMAPGQGHDCTHTCMCIFIQSHTSKYTLCFICMYWFSLSCIRDNYTFIYKQIHTIQTSKRKYKWHYIFKTCMYLVCICVCFCMYCVFKMYFMYC